MTTALRTDAAAEAVEGLAWAALTAVSLRMRLKPCVPRPERGAAREMRLGTLHTVYPVNASAIDDWHLLDGAWARVPDVAHRHGLNPSALVRGIDDYVRALIVHGRLPVHGDGARLIAMLGT